MAFNKRRQSRDSVLIEDLLSLVGKGTLHITDFSQKLFDGSTARIKVSNNPMAEAKESDYVFIENLPIGGYIDSTKKMVVYHWNRSYPADLYLDTPPMENGFLLKSSYEFVGSSHEKITREIWEK